MGAKIDLARVPKLCKILDFNFLRSSQDRFCNIFFCVLFLEQFIYHNVKCQKKLSHVVDFEGKFN